LPSHFSLCCINDNILASKDGVFEAVEYFERLCDCLAALHPIRLAIPSGQHRQDLFIQIVLNKVYPGDKYTRKAVTDADLLYISSCQGFESGGIYFGGVTLSSDDDMPVLTAVPEEPEADIFPSFARYMNWWKEQGKIWMASESLSNVDNAVITAFRETLNYVDESEEARLDCSYGKFWSVDNFSQQLVDAMKRCVPAAIKKVGDANAKVRELLVPQTARASARPLESQWAEVCKPKLDELVDTLLIRQKNLSGISMLGGALLQMAKVLSFNSDARMEAVKFLSRHPKQEDQNWPVTIEDVHDKEGRWIIENVMKLLNMVDDSVEKKLRLECQLGSLLVNETIDKSVTEITPEIIKTMNAKVEEVYSRKTRASSSRAGNVRDVMKLRVVSNILGDIFKAINTFGFNPTSPFISDTSDKNTVLHTLVK